MLCASTRAQARCEVLDSKSLTPAVILPSSKLKARTIETRFMYRESRSHQFRGAQVAHVIVLSDDIPFVEPLPHEVHLHAHLLRRI